MSRFEGCWNCDCNVFKFLDGNRAKHMWTHERSLDHWALIILKSYLLSVSLSLALCLSVCLSFSLAFSSSFTLSLTFRLLAFLFLLYLSLFDFVDSFYLTLSFTFSLCLTFFPAHFSISFPDRTHQDRGAPTGPGRHGGPERGAALRGGQWPNAGTHLQVVPQRQAHQPGPSAGTLRDDRRGTYVSVLRPTRRKWSFAQTTIISNVHECGYRKSDKKMNKQNLWIYKGENSRRVRDIAIIGGVKITMADQNRHTI